MPFVCVDIWDGLLTRWNANGAKEAEEEEKEKQEKLFSSPVVTIPYVEKTSEAVVRIMKNNVPCAMKPLKN